MHESRNTLHNPQPLHALGSSPSCAALTSLTSGADTAFPVFMPGVSGLMGWGGVVLIIVKFSV